MVQIPTYTRSSVVEAQLAYADNEHLNAVFWKITDAIASLILETKRENPATPHEDICTMAHLCVTSWLHNA